MFQMKIFLAIVMKNFVLSAVIPEHIPKLGNNGVLKSLNGLPINFKERHWDGRLPKHKNNFLNVKKL